MGGTKQQGAYLISIMSIVGVIVRLLIGFIISMTQIDPLMVYNFALIIAGIITFALPYLTKYWMLAVYCVLLASCLGNNNSCHNNKNMIVFMCESYNVAGTKMRI